LFPPSIGCLKLSYFLSVCLLLFAAHCAAFSAQKETIRFQHFGIEQGLPNSVVWGILLDSHGYLWIGTNDGLGRFDGYHFQVYRNDPEDKASLSHNDVRTLFDDRYGNLWIGTYGGLNRFDQKTGKFERYLHSAHDQNSISSDAITAIGEDGEGELWVGTWDAGLNKFNRHDDSFTRFERDTSETTSGKKTLRDNKVHAIIRDHEGALWIGTRGGWLQRLDPAKNEFDCYRDPHADTSAASPDGVRALCEDHSGSIWLGTFDAGIKKFDPVTQKFETFVHRPRDPASLTNNSVNRLLVDQSGDLWVATFNGGLDRWLSRQKKFEHHLNDPKNPASLSNDNVISLCEDRSGDIWVGTATGLDKYFAGISKFRNFRHDPDDPSSLSNNYVKAMSEDLSGNLWIATEGGGLNRFDRATGVFEHFFHNPRDTGSISSNYATDLCKDRSGTLWVGTLDGGLNKLNLESRTFEHFAHDPDNPKSISSNDIRSIYEDRSGILWVGTGDAGLNKVNPRTGESTHFFRDPNNSNSLTSNGIQDFQVDTSHRGEALLWIATNHGFTRFDVRGEEFQQFFPDAHRASRSNNVVQIYEDHSGTLWLATMGGLWSFEPQTRVFRHYTTQDGLASDLVWSLEEDDHGRLWIGTGNGLCRFDPRTKQFKKYDTGGGFQGSEFNYGSHCKLRSGELCFGGLNGFTMFHPDSIKENTHVPPIVITGFREFDKPVDIHQAIGPSGAIEVSYKENSFSFEFAALDFVRPEKNQYAYKLEGFDRDWAYCDTRRSATYTNLDGGEYVFRVKGCNNDGVWNEEGTSLAVIITPPFWATWWFRAIFFVTIAGLIGGAARYVAVRKLQRRVRTLEQQRALERERLRISRDMHDEVGANLTEIAILSELVKRDIQKPKEAETNVQKISEKARELIDSIGEIIWAINPRNDQLDSLTSYIREFASEYFEMASINCHFDFPAEIPSRQLSAEVRRNIFLTMKEAIHNAVKHSGATLVELSCRASVHEVEFSVQDNGRGFVIENLSGQGNGLVNMKKRIEDIDGAFQIESQPGNGTKIQLTVPLN
jgi:ligand-binding sensor domain-containing protein/signal transduction histidine kinase